MFEIYRVSESTNPSNYTVYFNSTNIKYTDLSLNRVADEIIHRTPRELFIRAGYTDYETFTPKELKAMYYKNNDIKNEIKTYITTCAQIIDNFTYVPCDEKLIVANTRRLFNTYHPNIHEGNKSHGYGLIKAVLINLFGDVYDYFEKFLAYKLQNPTEQPQIHFILYDRGGTGKTSFLKPILNALFDTITIYQDNLESEFNSFMKQSQFVICEEIERFTNDKKIKVFTGSDRVMIRELYKNPYEIPNHNTFLLFTNDLKMIKLDSNDRRFVVCGEGRRLFSSDPIRATCAVYQSAEAFSDFLTEWREMFPDEISSFHEHLINMPVTATDIYQMPQTRLRAQLIEMSKTSEVQFFELLIEMGIVEFFNTYIPDKQNFYNNVIFDRNEVYMSTDYFYQGYIEYCKRYHCSIISEQNFYVRFLKASEDSKIILDRTRKRKMYDNGEIHQQRVYRLNKAHFIHHITKDDKVYIPPNYEPEFNNLDKENK